MKMLCSLWWGYIGPVLRKKLCSFSWISPVKHTSQTWYFPDSIPTMVPEPQIVLYPSHYLNYCPSIERPFKNYLKFHLAWEVLDPGHPHWSGQPAKSCCTAFYFLIYSSRSFGTSLIKGGLGWDIWISHRVKKWWVFVSSPYLLCYCGSPDWQIVYSHQVPSNPEVACGAQEWTEGSKRAQACPLLCN